jgi:ribonucleotide reductase alpha subunit
MRWFFCRDIFETMYFAALRTSNELAKTDGPYSSYEGSPMSKGIVQPDMWKVDLTGSRHDWPGLRRSIAKHGVRSSLPSSSSIDQVRSMLPEMPCDLSSRY